MTISFQIHSLEIPLVRPFRTSFGSQSVRDVVLVEAVSDSGVSGWGECVTMAWPGYSAEYTSGAIDVMQKFLIPTLEPLLETSPEPDAVRSALSVMQGHPMAKSALSTALLDLWLKERETSLANYLGAVKDKVDCGVSVGIPSSIDSLLEEVGSYVDQGYKRIKLKIEPGWDIDAVRQVRNAWPEMLLQVDANQAYERTDGAHLAQLDQYDLLLIEQPLPEDDFLGHAMIPAKSIHRYALMSRFSQWHLPKEQLNLVQQRSLTLSRVALGDTSRPRKSTISALGKTFRSGVVGCSRQELAGRQILRWQLYRGSYCRVIRVPLIAITRRMSPNRLFWTMVNYLYPVNLGLVSNLFLKTLKQ